MRGLFDTDGSVYRRRKRDIVASIISRDPPFLEQVAKALREMGFNPSVSGKNLYLYSNNQVKKFFEEIQPANKKHLERYDRFIKEIKVQENSAPVV